MSNNRYNKPEKLILNQERYKKSLQNILMIRQQQQQIRNEWKFQREANKYSYLTD